MLLFYSPELSKLNACVTRLNQVAQNSRVCLCVSSGENGRLKYSPKHYLKSPKKCSSRLICNACGLYEASVSRTWSSRYLTRYTPNTKKRFRYIIVRTLKSGIQPTVAPTVAPLYPTKHRCLPKLAESLNITEDISIERGLPFEKIKTEMRKIAFKIKKDQWTTRTSLASSKIQNNVDKPMVKSAYESQSKALSKSWTTQGSNNGTIKVVIESKSLKDLKERINKKKLLESNAPLNFPVLAVGKLETEYPPSPYLLVSDSKVSQNENSSAAQKNEISSLPSPYFFIKKKFNKEVLAGTHSNSIVKAEKDKSVKTEPNKSVSASNAPSPRLLSNNSKDEYLDDPVVLRRRIDSALRHAFPKKNTLDVLASVQFTKEVEKENERKNKKSFPSPNLKEYSKLFNLRDGVPQTGPDTFSLKLLSSPNINKKLSHAKAERSKSDFSIKFDEYLRNLDKNIRNKTKSITIEANSKKEPTKSVSSNIPPAIDKPTKKVENKVNQQNISVSKLSSETNLIPEVTVPSFKSTNEESSQSIAASTSVEPNQTSDFKVHVASEELLDSEVKNHPQNTKKGLDSTPLLMDKSLSNIGSVFKKGIHSNSSNNAAKKHEDDDEFDKWKPLPNSDDTKFKKTEHDEVDRYDRQVSQSKWKRLSKDDIIKFNNNENYDQDHEERLARYNKRKPMSHANDIEIKKTDNYLLERQERHLPKNEWQPVSNTDDTQFKKIENYGPDHEERSDKQIKRRASSKFDDDNSKFRKTENDDLDHEEKRVPKNRVLHLFSKRTVEVSSPQMYPNDDSDHFVKPLPPSKEDNDISDEYVNHSVPVKNQRRSQNEPARRIRISRENQMNDTSNPAREIPQEYDSDTRSRKLNKADELHHENARNHDLRASQHHHKHSGLSPHRVTSLDEGTVDSKAHTDDNTLDHDATPHIHVRWQEKPENREPVQGQSAPYYPAFSRFDGNNRHEMQDESENYKHQNHAKPVMEVTSNDERFSERRDALTDYPPDGREDLASEDHSKDKFIRKRNKHYEDTMGSNQRQPRSEYSDLNHTDEAKFHLVRHKFNHPVESEENNIQNNPYEEKVIENDSSNPPTFIRQDESLISNEHSKLKQFSSYKEDLSRKPHPSSHLISTNENNIKSEYDPKPFLESSEKISNLSEEDSKAHRNNMQYEKSGSHQSFRKQPSHSKGSLEDQQSEEQSHLAAKQRRRRYEAESSNRNLHDRVDKHEVRGNRDSSSFDHHNLIREKIKRNRNVFIESEIRERPGNQPFEYTLADESKKSFEELKELVRNELQINNRNTHPRRGGGGPISSNRGSIKTQIKEPDFHRHKIISSREKAVTSDAHSKVDHNKPRSDQPSEESSVMKYHNRKYLSNSYYHLGKAKYSLEKYLENVGPETDHADNRYSPIKKSSEPVYSHEIPKQHQQTHDQENYPIRRRENEWNGDQETSGPYPHYDKPNRYVKYDMRSSGVPREEHSKNLEHVRHQAPEPTMHEHEEQPRRQYRLRRPYWPTTDLNKAAPKLQQKNSTWYNQFKNRIDPSDAANRATDPNSSHVESPPPQPDRVPSPYPSPPYPERYYFRKVVPSKPVSARQNTQEGQINEYYKDYYNKSHSTGAIDSIPPYYFNEAYSYGGEEPKYTENYSQFKNVNAAHLAQTSGRRNSHTIVSPSPFFSTPYEHGPTTDTHYNAHEHSQHENYWSGHNTTEEPSNLYSSTGYPYSEVSRAHDTTSNSYYEPTETGTYANHGTTSYNSQSANYDEYKKLASTPPANYSLGIDQLLRSEKKGFHRKLSNSYGSPSRFEHFTDSYKMTDSEPSPMFSKVPAMLSNSGRGLLELPRHLSGYFQKLVKWKSLGDYRYRDTDPIFTADPQSYHPSNQLPADVPISKETPFEKFSKPLVDHINKNVDNYYIRNSVIDNPMNSVYKAKTARQLNTNFGYTEEKVTPTMKVSKFSLNLKDNLPFLKTKNVSTVMKDGTKKENAMNDSKNIIKAEGKTSISEVSEDKEKAKVTEKISTSEERVLVENRDSVPIESTVKQKILKKPNLRAPQELKAPQPNPLVKKFSVAKKPTKISKLFKLSKSKEKLTLKEMLNKEAKEVQASKSKLNASTKIRARKNESAKTHTFLDKFMSLKIKNKVDVPKLKKPDLNDKKTNDEQAVLLAKDVKENQSTESKPKHDSVEPKTDFSKGDDGKTSKSSNKTEIASEAQAPVRPVVKKPEKVVPSPGVLKNSKLEGMLDKKRRIIAADNVVKLPRKKSRSKTMLNVFKHYVSPQSKKSPYKAFSDLYSK